MEVVPYRKFRTNIQKYLDIVNDNKEIVIVSKADGRNMVIIDLDEYNSIQTTLHLVSSMANRKRLDEAKAEMQEIN